MRQPRQQRRRQRPERVPRPRASQVAGRARNPAASTPALCNQANKPLSSKPSAPLHNLRKELESAQSINEPNSRHNKRAELPNHSKGAESAHPSRDVLHAREGSSARSIFWDPQHCTSVRRCSLQSASRGSSCLRSAALRHPRQIQTKVHCTLSHDISYDRAQCTHVVIVRAVTERECEYEQSVE